MKCTVCGNRDMVYKETITFSTGRTADIYVCRECGFTKRVWR